MKLKWRAALTGLLSLPLAFANATTYVTKEALEAYVQCTEKWKDVDGVWEGKLLTPGADIGGPYDKRVDVRLVFSRTGTTLQVKDKPKQAWQMVGDDPVPARGKTRLVVSVPSKDSKNPRGHQIVFTRLSESSARVIYSRGQINPKPSENVSMTDMRSGGAVREGSPASPVLGVEVSECGPR